MQYDCFEMQRRGEKKGREIPKTRLSYPKVNEILDACCELQASGDLLAFCNGLWALTDEMPWLVPAAASRTGLERHRTEVGG